MTFVPVPAELAPPASRAWGKTQSGRPVDGTAWVWRDRTHGTLLAVPKRIRAGKEEGEEVTVSLEPR